MRWTRAGKLSVAIVGVSTVLGGWVGGRAMAGTNRLSDDIRLYTAILATVEDEYVEDVKAEPLISSSIREMLRSLDPHSNFLETKEYGQLKERQKGSYYGLGLSVYSLDGNITVSSVFEGTPAHRLGIRAGDSIAKIGDEDARGMSIDDAVKRLKGPKGTSVHVTIVREGYDTPLEFSVVRDEIVLHAVPYAFMLNKRTGYVRLIDFNELTACSSSAPPDCKGELEQAIERLRAGGATSVVLDIRDNPGGLLDQAIAVSNLFFPRGRLVVFTRGRNKRDDSTFVTEREGRFADLPLVMLTSRHSASASEIVAGAIQDHDRGLIVGETTFGKALVQTVIPLRSVSGYALSLTTARYYTPSGRSIQRDYSRTALEDYVAPERRGCDQVGTDAKLTDAGRKVYGGDGITPDECVPAPKPGKFLAYLLGRNTFRLFARGYASATNGTEVAGTGTRSEAPSTKVKLIHADFAVDDAVLADFRAFLREKGLRFTEEDVAANREALSEQILEEVLEQVFGESEARKRSLQWDPQVERALQLVPKAELLLSDPKAFVAATQASAK